VRQSGQEGGEEEEEEEERETTNLHQARLPLENQFAKETGLGLRADLPDLGDGRHGSPSQRIEVPVPLLPGLGLGVVGDRVGAGDGGVALHPVDLLGLLPDGFDLVHVVALLGRRRRDLLLLVDVLVVLGPDGLG